MAPLPRRQVTIHYQLADLKSFRFGGGGPGLLTAHAAINHAHRDGEPARRQWPIGAVRIDVYQVTTSGDAKEDPVSTATTGPGTDPKARRVSLLMQTTASRYSIECLDPAHSQRKRQCAFRDPVTAADVR